jgi:hypothetical protein
MAVEDEVQEIKKTYILTASETQKLLDEYRLNREQAEKERGESYAIFKDCVEIIRGKA